MDVSIIIVNYNKYDDTIACINSLLGMKDIHMADIIIVDNCSTNDSYNILKERFFDQKIHILHSSENNGYCAGNNIGIKYAQQNLYSDYYWLLNPDTIVDTNAMIALFEFAESHNEAGLIGSKLVYYPDKDKIQALGGGNIIINKLGILRFSPFFHSDTVNSVLPEHIELDVLIGASMFLKKELVEIIGLMEESYFMYADETEFCMRAKKSSWKIYAVSNSIVWHKEGLRKQDQKCWAGYYGTRNFLFLLQQYYKQYLIVNILYKIYLSFRSLCSAILFRRSPMSYSRLQLKGIFDFFLQKKGKTDLSKYFTS